MPKGGARKGTGRKTQPIPESPHADQLERFSEQIVADLDRLYEAFRDVATGYRELRRVRKTGAKKVGEIEYRLVAPGDEQAGDEEWYVYLQPPNPMALQALVEHGVGRATQKSQVQTDTVINLIHHVPEPGSALPVEPAPAAPPLAPPAEPEDVDGIGIAAVIPRRRRKGS